MYGLRRSISQINSISKFHTFSKVFFKVGESIKPGIPALFENSPGNSVDLGAEVAKIPKSIIVGVPGAFSPACSASHIPGYIKHLKDFQKKGIDQIFVTVVNDPFVTKAWADSLKLKDSTGGKIRLIADAQGKFAESGDALFDASVKFFGNKRNYRFALVLENGKIIKEFVEPDQVGVKVSSAENVLKNL
ncbi:related to alkyl hydroperoxide reductase/peroxiredoxin [Saccharomycodes ludwigii]|uniref:Related to alkyl hydroperoxide reductase/peroxiredoxin n=1 Tax=Saccharomycodes ludwigii TaxID=36035 RepID=A0A376B7Z0_9ASCO|nr:hypothetical protein SCDLUD_005036 [Saccharomycodes ludwigii]KAH3898712.1 hypothetical protein SCDLUD_005036 [Saccharomycodes ludwigii]SSD60803.1 related to alkyl hydroperoxide reductase/peroxiredoxin [Saccharomycodes ludwigii]